MVPQRGSWKRKRSWNLQDRNQRQASSPRVSFVLTFLWGGNGWDSNDVWSSVPSDVAVLGFSCDKRTGVIKVVHPGQLVGGRECMVALCAIFVPLL